MEREEVAVVLLVMEQLLCSCGCGELLPLFSRNHPANALKSTTTFSFAPLGCSLMQIYTLSITVALIGGGIVVWRTYREFPVLSSPEL